MSPRLALLVLPFVAGIQNPVTPQDPPPVMTAKISGVVTRQDTGRPLANVTLRIIRWEGGLGQFIPPVRTEADGRFVVERLRAGEYQVTFSAPGFVGLDFGQKRPQEGSRRIELTDGEHFDKADIALPPTTAIEGRLVDEFGDPAPGIVVQVAQVQYAAGKSRLMPVGGGMAPRPTDDLGQFRIINLPPGNYYLMALAGPFAGPGDPSGFAVTYYPGTVAPAEAKPVQLELGRDLTGLTFQLIPAPMSTVSGVITDETDKPISGTVMFLPMSGGDVRSMLIGRVNPGPDGAFTFRNIAPGTYVIQAFGRPVGAGNLGAAPFASLPLTIERGRDITDLRVKVPPGTKARGKIILEGEAPPPAPTRVIVSPRAINFASSPVMGGPPISVTRDDWTFEVNNMSGSRVIYANIGSAQWTLKKVTLEGKDITDEPVDFSAADVNGLEITLTSRGPTLTGAVMEGDKPASDCMVIVFARDPARRTFPTRYLTVARPNAQGQFRIRELPAGDYLAVAVPTMQGSDWQDPEFLLRQAGLATGLSLFEGGTTTVALKVIRR
jgi:5-hydroxyisourate hydrolase-like protein (transthyretin family)